MHLRAIELSEVGTFDRPVRVEGLTTGVNVLAGPNELGKSTLLRGLMALFREPYRSAKRELQELRPYRGGAPRISCEFELRGEIWHLEKQFLAAPKVHLYRGDGSETHQGADAENRLADLFGNSADAAHLQLLWAQQNLQSFEVPCPSAGLQKTFGEALAAEVEAAAGLGRIRMILSQVEAERAKLVTDKTGKARKGGAYEQLLSEQKSVLKQLDTARTKRQDAIERLNELEALQGEERELSDAARLQRLESEIGALGERCAAAEKEQMQLQRLDERIQFLERQQATHTAALAAREAAHDEYEVLERAIAEASNERAACAEVIGRLSEQRTDHAQRLQAAERRVSELQGRREQQLKAEAIARKREQFQRLSETLATVQDLQAGLSTIEAELAIYDWPDDTLDKLGRTIAERDRLEASRTASAPRVSVRYGKGRSAAFKVAGAPLDHDQELIADGPIIIEIEGIGEIEIAPGVNESVETLAAGIARCDREIAACLGTIGAPSYDAAIEKEARRRERDAQRQLLLSRQSTLAPKGIAALKEDCEALSEGLAISDAPECAETDELPDLEAGLRELSEGLAQKRADLSVLDEQLADHKGRLIRYDSAIEANRQRRSDLAAQLALTTKEVCEQAVRDGEADLNAAVRERLAVREVALDAEALQALKADLQTKMAALASRKERLSDVRQQMRLLEGLLERELADGAPDQVRMLAERAEELARRLSDYELRIEALKVLAHELRLQLSSQQNQIAAPLTERMLAYTQRLWPSVDVRLNAEFGIEGISRLGQLEELAAISAGTREQLALLARLAYADLIAVASVSWPVILDDPLVFSDDQRLEKLFEILVDAGDDKQIIVLTCHARAFEPLMQSANVNQVTLESRLEAAD